MFGYVNRLRERVARLENQLAITTEAMQKAADKNNLIAISKNGRNVVLTFARKGEIYRITVYATIDFDVAHWTGVLIND